MNAELARQISLARFRRQHRPLEFELRPGQCRQFGKALAPARRRRARHVLPIRDPALHGGCDCVGGARQRIGFVLAEGDNLGKVGRRDEEGAVIVGF
jgi:hypothetical protein